MKNFKKKLYPQETLNEDNLLRNIKYLINYLTKNKYWIENIDIFSGEFFNIPYYGKILDVLIEYYKKCPNGFYRRLSIPTNGTFILYDKKVFKIKEYIKKFEELNVNINLSISIDGKLLDNHNRQFIDYKHSYTDDFYNKLFDFAREYNFGFHPMIHSHHIERWQENIEWFMYNLTKRYGCEKEAMKHLYLLDVRNPDWSEKQLRDYSKFMKYIYKRTFQIYGNDKEKYFNNFIRQKGMNHLGSVFSSHGRGIGCSIQSTLCVRIGDLHIVPCHRTSYEGYSGGKFIVKDDEIIDIVSINPELYMNIMTYNIKSVYPCSTCPINNLCNEYCLGTNYEINKDFFIPVPSVCKMQFVKAHSVAEVLDEIGLLKYWKSQMNGYDLSYKSIIQLETILKYKEK